MLGFGGHFSKTVKSRASSWTGPVWPQGVDSPRTTAQLRLAALSPWHTDREHLATGRPHQHGGDEDRLPQADATRDPGGGNRDERHLPPRGL